MPILFPGGHATLIAKANNVPAAQQAMVRQLGQQLWNAGLPVFDDLDGSSYSWNLPAGTPVTEANLRQFKTRKFIELLQAAQPGLTYIILHATLRTPTFDQISNSGPTRDGDRLAMLDPALRSYLQKEGIIVTTWRELLERRKKM